MAKQQWKPSTILNPVPAVMVSCSDREGKPNIITIAWAGTINSKPPMVSISIRKERYSYNLIKEKKQFVINLTTRKLAFAADFCGVKSGRDVDKFEAMKLTPEKASVVDVPMIKESPLNIECTVKDIIELGSHDMFIAQVEAINVDEAIVDKKGKLCMEKADLICYSHGEYWSLEKSLGYFGYSITKRKVLRRSTNKKGR
ncbi:flavin reductase family protein [Acetivibrio mesophilus]|uniref:Flavin reductase family protein n=1 Tax=Acetivibrio mesophilus TaxID=2487273 RepID=A0A4Q0I5K6_9FIRM|nr:flavin reductase family protein [Acetivibrio mesophilus]ODM25808.1 flavin reductase [Clostridium sp. Bc-iso-3]RXE59606.1 flavin reductase family protein [Acetivibrio mesophilus]HHV30499.1 flavin reductase family protein [Clostridium sp.]